MRLDQLTIKAQEALAAAQQLAQARSYPHVGLTLMALAMSAMALPVVSAQASKQTLQPTARISAQVDKTSLELGGQLTLTITIESDFAKAELQPFEFPKPFQVVAQRRSSQISLGVGNLTRSVSLIYILLAQEAGTFQLGPFEVLYEGKPLLTDPIEIVVSKPRVPPGSERHQRYTL